MNHSNERSQEGAATRAALLDAGRKLFGQRGYDGTSIRGITQKADANLGAVTYHFGSKEAFYGAVLQHVVQPLAAVLGEVAAGPGSALERVDQTARTYVRFLAANPDVPRLLLQEVAAGKVPPQPVLDVLSRVAEAIGAVIREGQARGEIREGDPFLMTLSLVAQPVYFALLRRVIVHIAEFDPMGDERLAALEDHVAAIVVAALAAPGHRGDT